MLRIADAAHVRRHHARISLLISDFLNGELDAAGVAELTGLLRADPAVVDQLVLDSFVHSQLHDWMHVRQSSRRAVGRCIPRFRVGPLCTRCGAIGAR